MEDEPSDSATEAAQLLQFAREAIQSGEEIETSGAD